MTNLFKKAIYENEGKEQKEFEQLDSQIPVLEAEQKELEEKMSSSDFAVVQKAGERYKEISSQLEQMYARWEVLSECL